MDFAHQDGPGLRLTVADACAVALNVLAYQHGQGPMFLDTLCVNKNVKLAWENAG